jgi:hypothetical protein
VGSLSCHPLRGYVAGPSTSQMHIGAVRERAVNGVKAMMVLLPIRKVDDPFRRRALLQLRCLFWNSVSPGSRRLPFSSDHIERIFLSSSVNNRTPTVPYFDLYSLARGAPDRPSS